MTRENNMEYREEDIQRKIHERFEPAIPLEQNNQEFSAEQPRRRKKHTRKRRVKKRPDRRRSRIIASMLAAIALYIIIRFLPVPFGSVIINGDTNITTKSLEEIGLIPNPINITQIDRSHLEKALANDLRVESINTTYKFPATIEIDLKKRTPIAHIITRYGYAEIDKNGQYISLSNSVGSKQIPIISGIQLGNVLLGDHVNNAKVKDGVKYLQEIGEEGRAIISEINVGDKEKLVAYTVDGVRIDLGKPEQLEEKAKLTLQMLKDIARQHVEVNKLDVNLDAPYVKKN